MALPRQHIAIIGAGTAGLAAAHMLAKQGHDITLYESAESLNPVGAGLLLQPSGVAVFQQMGILESARESCAEISGLVGKLPNGRKVVNSFYQQGAPEWFGLGVHRATLCDLLQQSLAGLSINWRMAHDVISVKQQDQSSLITVSHQGETQNHVYDLALICNGARSQLRPDSWVKLDKAYPWGAIWVIVAECDCLDPSILHQFFDRAEIMLGILPSGKLPSAHDPSGQRLSSVFWSLPSANLGGSDDADHTEELAAQITKRWSAVGEWVAALPADTQWLSAHYRDVVLHRFGQDNIGILGDAAHATSPQLGQGVNMALLDAWSLSQAFRETDNYAQLWQHYHQARRKHVHFYQRMSRLLTPFYQSHSRSLATLRDIAFPAMYHIPWLRKQMALTISGVKRGAIAKNLDLSGIRS